LRDLVEMMAERGVSLAHTTILRWVQRYAPEFVKRWNRFAVPAGPSWRVEVRWRTAWHLILEEVFTTHFLTTVRVSA